MPKSSFECRIQHLQNGKDMLRFLYSAELQLFLSRICVFILFYCSQVKVLRIVRNRATVFTKTM